MHTADARICAVGDAVEVTDVVTGQEIVLALGAATRVLRDVREPGEFAAGHIPGAVNMLLSEPRERVAGLPLTQPLAVYCAASARRRSTPSAFSRSTATMPPTSPGATRPIARSVTRTS